MSPRLMTQSRHRLLGGPIADLYGTACFLLPDGAVPSNLVKPFGYPKMVGQSHSKFVQPRATNGKEKFSWHGDRQVGGVGATQDLVHVSGRTNIALPMPGSEGHKTACGHIFSVR